MPLLIAVDLGAHATKVTTFRNGGRQVVVEGRFHEPVPQSGAVPPLEARIAALQALLDENPGWAGGGTIGMVMPSHLLAFRMTELPFTDPNQIDKTLPFAIESDVPYDLEDMALAWRHEVEEGRSTVLSTLVSKETLRAHLDALAALQMDPKRAIPDGELLSLFAPEEGTVALLDIGHAHTVVAVARDGVVRASRAIDVAGHAFTSAIQRALDCSWAEAESLKHGQDGASGYAELPAAAKRAVDDAIGLLLAEVRATLIRFEDDLGLDIERILVCGGSSRMPELLSYLASDLALPVERVADRHTGEPIPALFAQSHALAQVLAGQAPHRLLDLRVGELAYTGGTSTLRAVLTYGAIGGAFFAVAAVLIFAFQYTRLLSTRADIHAHIEEVVLATLPEVDPEQIRTRDQAEAIITAFTQDLIEKSELLPPANPEKPATIDRLYTLTKALPPHEKVPIELSSLELLSELITFEGETDGFAQSAAIEDALRATEAFARATKDSESRTTKGKIKFKFSIPLKDGEEG